MWKVTDIKFWAKWNKYYIYIDGIECTKFDTYRQEEIEEQLWIKIEIWNEIDCYKLKEIEKYLWKNKYKDSWWREKERIDLVKNILISEIPELKFEEIGFWVWSKEILYEHPDKKWWPDLKVIHPKYTFYLEVTWKQWCWKSLWIRPDKIEYYKTEKLEKSWFAHTCDKENEVFFIQIDLDKEYNWTNLDVNWTMENMVIFRKDDKWVYLASDFVKKLKKYLSTL